MWDLLWAKSWKREWDFLLQISWPGPPSLPRRCSEAVLPFLFPSLHAADSELALSLAPHCGQIVSCSQGRWAFTCCFPRGSAGKESACNAGHLGLIPGSGRSPGEGKGYPLQCPGLENSMDPTVHGVTKCPTWLSDFHFHFEGSTPNWGHFIVEHHSQALFSWYRTPFRQWEIMPGEWMLVWPLENRFLLWESSIEASCGSLLRVPARIFLVTQWLTLHAANGGDPVSIPDQGTRSHIPQLGPSTAKYKTQLFSKQRSNVIHKKQESQSKGLWGLSSLPSFLNSRVFLWHHPGKPGKSPLWLWVHPKLQSLWIASPLTSHPKTLDLLRMEISSSLHLCLPNLPSKWLCWE